MVLSVYLAFIAYACATTFAPGPNNVLLLTATGQYGFKRCLPLMCGIWTGLVTVMLLVGGFCDGLGKLIPRIAPVFRFVGAAYILYLAWKTWKRTPVAISDKTVEKPLTFYNGFLLQFLNVKVIMLGLASYPGYFLPVGGGVSIVSAQNTEQSADIAVESVHEEFPVHTFLYQLFKVRNRYCHKKKLVIECSTKLVRKPPSIKN